MKIIVYNCILVWYSNYCQIERRENKMTIKLTTDRHYIDRPECCVYIDKHDGRFMFQDIFGYKSYKTINGLNKMLAKVCKMANIETIICEA